MQAMEVVRPGSTLADPAAAAAIAAACHAQGVVVLTCGTWGNVIRLLPPLTIEDALLNEGLDVLAAATTMVLA
jgi:4-aminobutyrate aminotransferase/(S)-3-amino-2-methylpropionate transaminase